MFRVRTGTWNYPIKTNLKLMYAALAELINVLYSHCIFPRA